MNFAQLKLKRRYNVILSVLVAIICTAIIINSGTLDNAGMAVIVIIWIPTIIGLFTVLAFFIVYIFTKKFAYLITLAGIAINLLFTVALCTQ